MIAKLASAVMARRSHHTLIFHRVLSEVDPMSPDEPTASWFHDLLVRLKSRFEIIPLGDAIQRAANGDLKGRTLSITFDDGYADNCTVALPVLEQLELPATFFVASAFIDGGRMWNDSIIETYRRLAPGPHRVALEKVETIEVDDWSSRRAAASAAIAAWKHLHPDERQARVDELALQVDGLPNDLMMTGVQLRRMAESPYAEIGGHTRNHPILASLPVEQAGVEIEGGKVDLEAFIGRPLRLFAYPNGKLGRDYRPEHAELVREAGFDAAVATDWGTLDNSTDLYSIPRFTPWHRNYNRFFIDLARCHYGMI